jgi:hypothetical protein
VLLLVLQMKLAAKTIFSIAAALILAGAVPSLARAQAMLETNPQSAELQSSPTPTPARSASPPQAPPQSSENTLQLPAAQQPPAPESAPTAAPPYNAAAAIAAAAAAAAIAAAVMNSQNQPQPPPAAAPRTSPPPPAPEAPPSEALSVPMTTQASPALPAVFRGCWQGAVNELDWIKRLPGAHRVGYWTPKTYRLCYRRVGSGPFTLTFTETGVAPSEKIINARGQVHALATNGRDWAKMRSNLHFDEYQVAAGPGGDTFSVDETAMLDCQITNNVMRVSATVYGTRDGAPWFRAHWTARFMPTAE